MISEKFESKRGRGLTFPKLDFDYSLRWDAFNWVISVRGDEEGRSWSKKKSWGLKKLEAMSPKLVEEIQAAPNPKRLLGLLTGA